MHPLTDSISTRRSRRRFTEMYAQSELRVPILTGFVSLLISVMISLCVLEPRPCVTDEFSYLLAADTFRRGRLSNPEHPYASHFETQNVIQHPTHASKYPPAPGLAMAGGRLICGKPICGVWLSTAFACAAMSWMLSAWMPRRWAAYGGILTAFHPTMLDWSQSFWGGSLAVLGGALVWGAVRRFADAPSFRVGSVLALGMIILANTRPFEGLIVSLAALVALMISGDRRRTPACFTRRLRRLVPPLLAVLTPAALGMGLYNASVTGAPLRLPYQVYENAWGAAPSFLWQGSWRVPDYRHAELREANLALKDIYDKQRDLHGFLVGLISKLGTYGRACFPVSKVAGEGSSLAITAECIAVLIYCCSLSRGYWSRSAAYTCLATLTANLATTWRHEHYMAPAAPVVVILAMTALRRIHVIGSSIVRSNVFMIVFTSLYLLNSAACIAERRVEFTTGWLGHIRQREDILAFLQDQPGSHLVFVDYGPNHLPYEEWVYNEADIDRSRVVWARRTGSNDDLDLVRYFKGRRVWRLQPDSQPPRLTNEDGDAQSTGGLQ